MLTFDIAFFDIQILVNPPRGNGDFMFMVVLDMMHKMYQPHASLVKYKNTKNIRRMYVASDMMHKMLQPHASLIKGSPRLSAN